MKEGILTMEQGNGFYSKEKEMKYVEHLVKSMEFLAEDERTIFIGQSVKYSGNSIFNTLKTIPDLDGYIPITCYPRFDFLLLAVNQMVNHLDKMKEMTRGEFDPRVIVRTSIGAKTPLDGGLQHTQDHTQAFRHLLDNVNVVLLENKEDIFPAYKKALLRDDNKSSLIIEFGEYYNQ